MASRFGEAWRGLWLVLTSYGLLMVPAALTGLALGWDVVPAAALALSLQVVIWGDARFRWVPLRDRLRDGRIGFQFPGPRCRHEAEWCSTCEPSLRDAISEQENGTGGTSLE